MTEFIEFLKNIFWIAFYITGIIAVIVLAVSIILGTIDAIIAKKRKKKAIEELNRDLDKFAAELIKAIEEEEAKKAVKETKKTKKTVKKEEK